VKNTDRRNLSGANLTPENKEEPSAVLQKWNSQIFRKASGVLVNFEWKRTGERGEPIE
jgi:hypothetical protein